MLVGLGEQPDHVTHAAALKIKPWLLQDLLRKSSISMEIVKRAGLRASCTWSMASTSCLESVRPWLSVEFPQRLAVVGGEGRNPMTPFSSGTKAVGTLAALDPDAGAWSILPSLPHERTRCAVIGNGSFLYVLGGEVHRFMLKLQRLPLAAVDRFDADNSAWDALTPLPHPRGNLAAVMVSGCIYAIGGFDGRQAVATTERLDLKTRSWDALPPMPTPREGMAVAALHNRIFAVGGRAAEGALGKVGAVESLHLSEQVWETLAPAPALIVGQCSAVAYDKHIYVCGGYSGDGQEKNWQDAAFQRYNAKADTWDVLPGMAVPRRGFAMVALNDRLFTFGGYKEIRVCAVAEALELTCTQRGWASAKPMPHQMGHAAAAVIRLPRCHARK